MKVITLTIKYFETYRNFNCVNLDEIRNVIFVDSLTRAVTGNYTRITILLMRGQKPLALTCTWFISWEDEIRKEMQMWDFC